MQKLKRAKIILCALLTVMRYGLFVQKPFNTKIYRTKYFGHKIFAIYGIIIIIKHALLSPNSPNTVSHTLTCTLTRTHITTIRF